LSRPIELFRFEGEGNLLDRAYELGERTTE
jgi:hypothetical protein